MAEFLYRYLQLFSYMGAGTPEDPGGDFGMSVVIEAEDEAEAARWGKVLLEDYVRARYKFSDPAVNATRFAGDVMTDQDKIEKAKRAGYPSCKAGEIPTWVEPWRRDNASRMNP